MILSASQSEESLRQLPEQQGGRGPFWWILSTVRMNCLWNSLKHFQIQTLPWSFLNLQETPLLMVSNIDGPMGTVWQAAQHNVSCVLYKNFFHFLVIMNITGLKAMRLWRLSSLQNQHFYLCVKQLLFQNSFLFCSSDSQKIDGWKTINMYAGMCLSHQLISKLKHAASIKEHELKSKVLDNESSPP